jgi:hypothetical protein
MSDSLRDALEKLADEYEADARADGGLAYHRVVGQLRKLLAAHPAEPVGVSDEAVVTPEMVMAAATAIGAKYGHDGAMYCADAERALEAARPFMQPQVVASRERVVEVLRMHRIECTGPGEVTCGGCRERSWMSWWDYHQHIADAVLALMGGAE